MTLLHLDTSIAPIRPGKNVRSGGDSRGNAASRRARKLKLLADPFFNGNGETVPCVHCGIELSFRTVEADRIVPGSKGGKYVYGNLIPACRKCNSRRGDQSLWTFNVNLMRRIARRDKRAERIAA